MTYVIDLQRLWNDRPPISNAQRPAMPSLDPRAHLVSVIVAATQEKRLLETLKSVLAQLFIREVIIVNAGSISSLDKVLENFAKFHPRCYLVSGHGTLGLPEAYNLGAQYASGQFLLFLDAACYLPLNTMSRLLSTGISKPLPWVIGVKPFGQFFNDKTVSKSTNFFPLPEVSLAGGGIHVLAVARECLLIPTRAFVELRGMDKKCQDTFHLDLCLRAHLAGGGVYQVKDLALNMEADADIPYSFFKRLRHKWLALCNECYLYQKYVSKRTNVFKLGIYYGLFVLRFVVRLMKPRLT